MPCTFPEPHTRPLRLQTKDPGRVWTYKPVTDLHGQFFYPADPGASVYRFPIQFSDTYFCSTSYVMIILDPPLQTPSPSPPGRCEWSLTMSIKHDNHEAMWETMHACFGFWLTLPDFRQLEVVAAYPAIFFSGFKLCQKLTVLLKIHRNFPAFVQTEPASLDHKWYGLNTWVWKLMKYCQFWNYMLK